MKKRQSKHSSRAAGTVRGWRWSAEAKIAALMAGAMMLIATAAQAKLTACSPPAGTPPVGTIKQCCRITKPGDYTVAGPLTSSGGTCIKIVASGVVLDGNGQTITGAGTGVGIRLTPAAAGDVVHDVADISNFKTGILDDAARSVITSTGSTNDAVEKSVANGVVIRANRVYLAYVNSDGNDGNGIVVKPVAPALMVSNVYLSNVDASGNKKAGAVLKSLSGFTASISVTGDNGGDGTDLIDSVAAQIADGYSYGNHGDGIKITGGHDEVVNNEEMGSNTFGASPNATGLEVRNSVFDTFDDDSVDYSIGDGLLIVNGKHEKITAVEAYKNGGNGIVLRNSPFDALVDGSVGGSAGDGLLIVNGKHESVAYLYFTGNGGSGIHLKRTTSSRAYGLRVYSNGGAGVWLDGSQGITVEGVSSFSDSKSGVYIGCSTGQEPDGTKCASQGLPASNGNRVVENTLDSSSRTPKPDFGIGIDLGNHHNQVLSNTVKGATIDDLMDDNRNCDSNLWMFNTFDPGSASPASCIQ